jgi:hypothetical protein
MCDGEGIRNGEGVCTLDGDGLGTMPGETGGTPGLLPGAASRPAEDGVPESPRECVRGGRRAAGTGGGPLALPPPVTDGGSFSPKKPARRASFERLLFIDGLGVASDDIVLRCSAGAGDWVASRRLSREMPCTSRGAIGLSLVMSSENEADGPDVDAKDSTRSSEHKNGLRATTSSVVVISGTASLLCYHPHAAADYRMSTFTCVRVAN